jgi:8-oxo-dGTP diphosphatase
MTTQEKRFLDGYDPDEFDRPSVTVDLVIFTVIDTDLKVLLVRRGAHPFKGAWALPGGFVNAGRGRKNQGEDIATAAHRELAEETGLPQGSCYLEQLYTFGRAGRDPRTRVITVAWYALVRPGLAQLIHAGDDAAEAQWFSVAEEVQWMRLAFDHAEILAMGVERIRGKIDYCDIAFDLVPQTFTVAELRAVHEAIQDKTHDPRNFRRRFQRMVTDGIIVPAPGKRHRGKARPAKVWRYSRTASEEASPGP